MNLDLARTVADAVLYEGYLLYPYRASSTKNRVRWQFGVLGPPGAAEAGVGENATMSMQCLLAPAGLLAPAASVGEPADESAEIAVHLRFLQLQRRQLYDAQGQVIEELSASGTTWLSWDEAVEREVALSLPMTELARGITAPLHVAGGTDVEPLLDDRGTLIGTVSRQRWPLGALLSATITPLDGYTRLTITVRNASTEAPTSVADAIRASFLGAHLLVEAYGVAFASLLDPPPDARSAVAACTQDRCWPVLVGEPGSTDLVLGSPIILYDYPEIAAQSPGALFDATEIDEILTLRVMTMTDEEKSEARATDPRAADIINRCDQMSPEALQELHGILRNPHAEQLSSRPNPLPSPDPPWPEASDIRALDPPTLDTAGVPWWDPAADSAVRPDTDAVTINGVSVSKGSLVRVHPNRRADAQDLFFADQVARVTAVLSDVDGEVHVALVLLDDPAADLHEVYGRYFYYAPDELEPLPPATVRSQVTANH